MHALGGNSHHNILTADGQDWIDGITAADFQNVVRGNVGLEIGSLNFQRIGTDIDVREGIEASRIGLGFERDLRTGLGQRDNGIPNHCPCRICNGSLNVAGSGRLCICLCSE